MQTDYSNWITSLMERHRLTPYSLAKRSGVPQPTIYRIQSGESLNPKSDTLRKLAAAVGESIARIDDEHDDIPMFSRARVTVEGVADTGKTYGTAIDLSGIKDAETRERILEIIDLAKKGKVDGNVLHSIIAILNRE